MLSPAELAAAIDAARVWPERRGGCWTSTGRGLTEAVRGIREGETLHPALAVFRLRKGRGISGAWRAFGDVVEAYGLATGRMSLEVDLSVDPKAVADRLDELAQRLAVNEELKANSNGSVR